MSRTSRILLIAVVALFAASSAPIADQMSAQAPSQNVKTMAGILAKLNHFPNDAEKKTLQGIVASETAAAHEKTLAQALINLQHAVTADDKTKLEALMKDQAAPAPAREIAGILVRLNHTPSDAEKAQLTKMAAAN